MWRFVVRRLLLLIPVLLMVAFLICSLLALAPGDPATAVLGTDVEQVYYDEWREARGLDDPFFVQFANYVWGIVTRFDFGMSFRSNSSVTEKLISRIPTSFLMGIMTTLASCALGVSLGIYAAKHRNSIGDNIIRVMAMCGSSVPSFVIALLLILLFSVKLKWLPATGFYGVQYIILPVVTVGIGTAAGQMRFARSSVLDCMRQDYVRTARAKGQTENVIMRHHILRNALIPIITMVGSSFGNCMGGQVIIEQVFSIPGLGKLMIDAINSRDYPQIKGSVILFAVGIGLVNLLVDVAYAYIDPRIKATFSGKTRKKA